MVAGSMPRSVARRRALGEILISGAPCPATGSPDVRIAERPASDWRPVRAGGALEGAGSPGFTSQAMIAPTGTTAPSRALTAERTPSPGASTLDVGPRPLQIARSPKGARSSAGEHSLHTGGVTGSIPVAPTISPVMHVGNAFGKSKSANIRIGSNESRYRFFD